MDSENPQGEGPVTLPETYVRKAMFFVVNAHAATVNMRLYPPTSAMVTETIEKAMGSLEELLDEGDHFTVSTIENALLINDVRLDELDQGKTPIRSFVAWMTERGLSNLEFQPGVTGEELKTVLEVLNELMDDPDIKMNLTERLEERGVDNVAVNQRVYVSISAGDEVGEFGRKSSPLDALKDELLIRYLMGKVELGEVENREMVDVLSDSGKVGGLLTRFLAEEGAEGGVLMRSQQAEDALGRLSAMVDQIEDESLKESLTGQITNIVAEMSPREMTSVLSGEAPETLNLRHVRRNVITMLSDDKLMDIVDSLIDEYVEMKGESGELETDWLRDRLRSLNDVLLEVRGGERGGVLAEKIDQKLEQAGIEEERDAATGTRVLSARQMLGGPLEEEDLPDLGEGVDPTVSTQIHKLFVMGETDLASGMLYKLAENLDNESPKVRRYAAILVKQSLEELEPENRPKAAGILVPRLMGCVSDEQDYETFVLETDSLALVAETFLKSGRADDAARILELLGDESAEDSQKGTELVKHASGLLEELVGPEGAIDVVELLSEPDEQERQKHVEALARLGPEAISPLVQVVKDRGQVDLREAALQALQSVGAVGTQALVAELKSENPWYIYRNILNVLAEMRETEAVEEIAAMATHPDERIRREAVRALARIGAPQSLLVVQNAANDSSATVRRTAVRVLGMFGDTEVAPYLFDIINGQGLRGKEEDQGVAEAACLALGDLHDPAFVPQLSELLSKGGLFKKGKPEEIRAAVCMALGTIGDPAALPVLEKAQKDPSLMVRGSAEKAIKHLRGEVTTPQLVSPTEGPQAGPPAGSAETETMPLVEVERRDYTPDRGAPFAPEPLAPLEEVFEEPALPVQEVPPEPVIPARPEEPPPTPAPEEVLVLEPPVEQEEGPLAPPFEARIEVEAPAPEEGASVESPPTAEAAPAAHEAAEPEEKPKTASWDAVPDDFKAETDKSWVETPPPWQRPADEETPAEPGAPDGAEEEKEGTDGSAPSALPAEMVPEGSLNGHDYPLPGDWGKAERPAGPIPPPLQDEPDTPGGPVPPPREPQ